MDNNLQRLRPLPQSQLARLIQDVWPQIRRNSSNYKLQDKRHRSSRCAHERKLSLSLSNHKHNSPSNKLWDVSNL